MPLKSEEAESQEGGSGPRKRKRPMMPSDEQRHAAGRNSFEIRAASVLGIQAEESGTQAQAPPEMAPETALFLEVRMLTECRVRLEPANDA